MSEKSEKILKVANQLFVEQGYRGTNMQAIADNCGISKGAIYLHFKSKEQILIGLLKRMDNELFDKLDRLEKDPGLSQRDRFKAQILCQIDLSAEHKQLTDLFIQDAMTFTEELHTFVGETRHRWQMAQQRAVANYFGDQVSPWQVDISIIISGMLNEYASYWLLEKIELPMDALIEMVVFATEQIVIGLVEHKPCAVFSEDNMPNTASLEEDAKSRREHKISQLSKELSALITSLEHQVDRSEYETLQQTTERLTALLAETQPDLIVLRALLASLREYPNLQETRREIATLFKIKLI